MVPDPKRLLIEILDTDIVNNILNITGKIKTISIELDQYIRLLCELDGSEYIFFKNKEDMLSFTLSFVKTDMVSNPDKYRLDRLTEFMDLQGIRDYLWDELNGANLKDINKLDHVKLKSDLVRLKIIIDNDQVISDTAKQVMADRMTTYMLSDPIQYLGSIGYYGENLIDHIGDNLDLDKASEHIVAKKGIAECLVEGGNYDNILDTGQILIKVK